MVTFNQALYDLYTAGRISVDEALRNADSRTDLQLRIKLSHGVSGDTGDLSMMPGEAIRSFIKDLIKTNTYDHTARWIASGMRRGPKAPLKVSKRPAIGAWQSGQWPSGVRR